MGILQYNAGKLSISKSGLRLLLIIILLSGITVWAISAIPEGADVFSVGAPQTRTAPSAENVTADGGNITEVNISVAMQTTLWQGFFGDVNGSIILEDTSGDLFYAWNLSNTSGEVYASWDANINFANIFPMNNCSTPNNMTTGTGKDDSVNETYFNGTNLAVTVGNVIINASTSCAMTTYVSSAPSEQFNALILTDDPDNSSADCLVAGNICTGGNTSVFVALIEDATTGFDGGTHDYQLLVPINVSTGFMVYYFYAEVG